MTTPLTRADLEAALASHPTHADLEAALASHPTHADLDASIAVALEPYATRADLKSHPTHTDLAVALEPFATRLEAVAMRVEAVARDVKDLKAIASDLDGRIAGMFDVITARLAPQNDANQLVQQQLDDVRTEVREHTSDLSVHAPIAVRPKRRAPARRRRR